MDPKIERQCSDSVELRDCGAATEVTKGDFIEWPYLEAGSPPYIYLCPECG